MGSYLNRLVELNDIPELNSIIRSAFGVNVDPEILKKKYFHKYQKKDLSFISFSEERTGASFYGMIYMKATYNGDVFPIGQSCDSMTHKSHGGKGLFVNLANEAYKNAKEKGIEYIFGFPNETIYPLRTKKLNWLHYENINVFQVKISTFPFAKLAKKLPFFRPLYLAYVNRIVSIHKSHEPFFRNSVLAKNVGGILHDADYFEYKSSKDKFVIKIGNIHLWIKIDGYMWIGDFEKTNKEEFNQVFNKLKNIASRIGCSSIVFRFQEGTSNSELLKHFLDVDHTMPLGYIHLTEKHKNKIFKFSGADFDSW